MRLTRFFRRRFWDDERARELQAYLDQETEDNIARGMSPDAAARAAHVKLGNVTRIREEIYTMNSLGLIESIWQDLRYGARLLRRNPTFSIVAVLTLALGTGANTAMFQLVDAVRLRTLPVVDPQDLVEVQIDTHDRGRTGAFISRRAMLTNPIWERIRGDHKSFSSIMAWSNVGFDLADGGEVRPAEGLWVSGAFFNTLGVKAHRGRLIAQADDTRGCTAPGAVLSHAFWQREYAADPSIVGRTILLDGHRFDVIGITEPRFFGVDVGRSFDVALPLCSEPIFRGVRSALDRSDTWFLASFARLRPGATAESATAEFHTFSPGLFQETLPARYLPVDRDAYLGFHLRAISSGTGTSSVRGRYSTPLMVLLSVTGIVLFIACANLANLMLARATAREREVAVRLAIGASRRRIVRQMLSESFLLAVAGAGAGLLLARWLSSFLVSFLSTDRAPMFVALTFDWRVFAFTASVACAACLLFGLTPALRATAAAPTTTTLGSRGSTERAERFTFRRMLVVVQVALSLVLLVGALLLGRSLRNLMTLDPGFRQDGVLIVELDFRRANVPLEAQRAVSDALLERVAGIPGVESVAEAAIAPMSGSGWNERLVVDGKPQQMLSNFNAVGPGYFRTLGTRLTAGREFNERDIVASQPVAVVNELFAKTYFPNQSPIGRRFHVEDAPGSPPTPRYQIVGVVADTKYRTLREQLSPIAYLAAAQQPVEDPGLQLVVHSTIGAGAVTASVSQAVREQNPAITVRFQTMEFLVSRTLTSERLMAALSGFFGGLAVLIAVVGLYGVMSYIVARRRMEIGIRMALGADRATVVKMVVRDAMKLLAVGLTAGVVLSVLGARSASALLYGLQPWDPITLAVGIIALGSVAIAASWWPAYRASRVAPTVALREG